MGDPDDKGEVSGKADGKRLREEKNRKWQIKQEFRLKKQKTIDRRKAWLDAHSKRAYCVTDPDVDAVKKRDSNNSVEHSINRYLRPYLNLQESGEKLHSSDGTRRFIAEGAETVRLLMTQNKMEERKGRFSSVSIDSILVKPSLFFDKPVHLVDCYPDSTADNDYRVLIAEEAVMCNLLGFKTARGALACGLVPDNRDEEWLMQYLGEIRSTTTGVGSDALHLLALDGVGDTSNMGSIIRCASAFGVHAMILSKDCCDPWYRRSIRVSMGHIFRIPCVRVENLASTLNRVAKEMHVPSYAAIVEPADLVLENVSPGSIPKSWCCIMGSEGNGISPQVLNSATHSIRIEMAAEVDSLSVPVATGILLHGMKEKTRTKL